MSPPIKPPRFIIGSRTLATGLLAALLSVTLAMLTAPPAQATPREEQIKACRKVLDTIERKEAQRRRGGNARQMERWKTQLRAAQDRYSRLDCKRWRRHLR